MASINILPVNVLERLTRLLVTSEQMRLWQCGDRTLNLKLQNGGLTSTTLHWSSTPWMPWPLYFFDLFTDLTSVNWTVDTRSSLCPSLDLNVLPLTLHRLQLEFDDVFYILRPQHVNLNAMFPLLQILKLKGKRMSEDNLQQLPQQLIELSVVLEYDSRRTKRLPSDSFKVPFRDLPSTLEHLKLGFRVADLDEIASDFPSGLKSLHISHIEANFDWFSKLPKSLKILGIGFSNYFDVSLLPAELEELDLGPVPFSKSLLPSLPKGLKSLRLNITPNLTDDDIKDLPKTLTKADITPHQLTHIGLEQLPTTLTDTSFSIQVTHPDTLSFYHPETTKMSIFSLGSPELNLFPLPLKLASLTIDCINDDISGLLPHQLTYLKLDGGCVTAKGAAKFPKSLKFLSADIGAFDTDETISYIGFIPHIQLFDTGESSSRKVTENWLSFLKPSPLLSLDTEQFLPDFKQRNSGPGEILEVTIQKANFPLTLALGESCFQTLSTFTHLAVLHVWVTFGTFIPASYIQYVPKSLTDLRFGDLEEFPTTSDLLTLPKCLRYLHLSVKLDVTCPWKDEHLEALPRSLQYFNLYCSRLFSKEASFTSDTSSSLPPHLMEINVNYDPSIILAIPPPRPAVHESTDGFRRVPFRRLLLHTGVNSPRAGWTKLSVLTQAAFIVSLFE